MKKLIEKVWSAQPSAFFRPAGLTMPLIFDRDNWRQLDKYLPQPLLIQTFVLSF